MAGLSFHTRGPRGHVYSRGNRLQEATSSAAGPHKGAGRSTRQESGGVRPRGWGLKTGSDKSVPCASPSFKHLKPSGLLIVITQGGKHCGYSRHADEGPKLSKGCVVGPQSQI